MRPTFSRFALWSLTAAIAFLAGSGAEHLWQRDALAQSAQPTSTIYVPPGGVVFRSLDGKPLARISRDPRGGAIELYDSEHEVVTRILTSEGLVSGEKARPAPPQYVLDPYLIDEDDPWIAKPAAPPKPAPGF